MDSKNTDQVHPAKRSDAPHTRLRLAIALMSMIVVAQGVSNMRDSAGVMLYSLVMPMGLFLAYFGIYYSRGLHWLWGGVCLFGSIGLVLTLIWHLFTQGSLPPSLTTPWPIMGFIPLGGVGYLLIVDRKVAEYRKALRDFDPRS